MEIDPILLSINHCGECKSFGACVLGSMAILQDEEISDAEMAYSSMIPVCPEFVFKDSV